MELRPATVAAAEAAAALATAAAPVFLDDPEAAAAPDGYLHSIDAEAFRARLEDPEYAYTLAWEDGELLGLIGIRGATHLYHLFVAEAARGRGVSRRLWQHALQAALQAGAPGPFTVNSSPNAVPVYERFGFRRAGDDFSACGATCIPMTRELRP